MNTTDILQRLITLNDDRAANKAAARENMLVAAQALVTSLQTPSEFISCVGWAEPARFACIRTALDLRIFETLDQRGSNDGMNVADLTRETGAEEGLVCESLSVLCSSPAANGIVFPPDVFSDANLAGRGQSTEDERMLTGLLSFKARILKHLVAMNVLGEPATGRYANTKLSAQLTEPRYRDGLLYCYDVAGPSFRQMPAYFNKNHFKQPLNPIDGPFQFAHGTQDHFFTWLSQNPAYFGAFANYMAGYRGGKQPWFTPDFYPVKTQLIDGISSSSSLSRNDAATPTAGTSGNVLLVDVGGGKGHDLLGLRSAFPSLPGTLVLQDTAEVVASIDPPLPSDIHVMSHDFFTTQPVKGAKAYFLHSVLHDWDDRQCVQILEALKPALIPGYSKVLVHDLVVPDSGATWGVTSMDMLMMALGSVRERTEDDFRRLFDTAGLQIDKIWIYEQGTEGVIEASLPLLSGENE